MRGWQANIKRTRAPPVLYRVMPENEIPPLCGGITIVKLVNSERKALRFIEPEGLSLSTFVTVFL